MTTAFKQILEIPEETSIKTGSYVVPAGKYVKYKVLSATDQAFTVNGVVAEERTHYQLQRHSASATNFSIALPVTQDSSDWLCEFTFVADPVYSQQISLINSTTNSSAQFANKALKKSGSQLSGVNEGFHQAPAGSGTLSTTRCEEFRLPSAGVVHVLNGDSWILLPIYSYIFLARRERSGEMANGIVPAGTVLNGDRYQVEIYAEPKENFPEDLKVGN